MTVGIVVMGCLSVSSFVLKNKYSFQPKLNFTTEGCSAAIWQELGNVTLESSALLPASDL